MYVGVGVGVGVRVCMCAILTLQELQGGGVKGKRQRRTGDQDRVKISCQERKGGPLGVNTGLHPLWPTLVRSATWGH